MNNTSNSKDQIRNNVWIKLREFALPDSRFHWDFTSFIPDFIGSEECNNKIRSSSEYRRAHTIFITPDNCLESLRRFAIEDKKAVLMSTYGIKRDFVYVQSGSVPKGDEKYAATLDGIEKYGKHLSILTINSLAALDLLVTGASVISTSGIRWGKGHGYFDLEWAMFRECGLVSEDTPIFSVGHDCQVVEMEVEVTKYDTIVDKIFTPTKVIDVEKKYQKPSGVYWESLTSDQFMNIPALKQLMKMK